MDIIKYFYEEPASLEVLSPDLDPDARRQQGPTMPLETLLEAPRYHRGYLAGTDLGGAGSDIRVGATAIARPRAFVQPLLDWMTGGRWLRGDLDGRSAPVDRQQVGRCLRAPEDTAVLVWAGEHVAGAHVAAVAQGTRRQNLPALRRLLDEARVVLFPEPAHDGHDWSLFSARPMHAALTAALRRHPEAEVRRFVLPYQAARSEERFYFEQYDLSRYAAFEVG